MRSGPQRHASAPASDAQELGAALGPGSSLAGAEGAAAGLHSPPGKLSRRSARPRAPEGPVKRTLTPRLELCPLQLAVMVLYYRRTGAFSKVSGSLLDFGFYSPLGRAGTPDTGCRSKGATAPGQLCQQRRAPSCPCPAAERLKAVTGATCLCAVAGPGGAATAPLRASSCGCAGGEGFVGWRRSGSRRERRQQRQSRGWRGGASHP